MADKDPQDPIEKKSYSKHLFVLGSLFMVASLLAILDDEVVRRTWKAYKSEFKKLELEVVQRDYDALIKKLEGQNLAREKEHEGLTVDQLPNDPEKLSLKEIRLKLERARIALEDSAYRNGVKNIEAMKIVYTDAKERAGFAKADQDEIYYEWKHAKHEGHDEEAAAYKTEYYEIEEKIKEYTEMAEKFGEDLEGLIKTMKVYDNELAKWLKAEEAYFAAMTQLQSKRATIKQKPLSIDQVVIKDLGIQGVVEWGKVDRCMSCHAGVDRNGFENFPAPFATHPHRDVLLKKHPVEEFGCTTCHWGQGRATQIKHEPLGHDDFAHGFEHHWQKPLLQGDFVQSSCIKCHTDQWNLEFAPVATAGKRLFMEMGCIGCHNIGGFEDYPKAGPSLEKLASKLNPEWIVPWILDPARYDPNTRMPQAPLNEEQATQIASYLFQVSSDYKRPYGSYKGTGDAARGKQLFTEVGCYGCHTMENQGSKFAPTLDRIMEKTNPDWVYNWIQNPKSYHGGARMPSLRLTKQEAADITAYLAEKGEASPVSDGLRQTLQDPANKEKGFLLITQYGCYGCHNISGTETLSKLSVDLSTMGAKTIDKLDFGDTDVPLTWEDWVSNKIKDPDIYVHERSSSAMPQFRLSDEEIHSLVVFLKGMQGDRLPERFVMSKKVDHQKDIEKGRRLVRRYNCIGCHTLEGEGGSIQDVIGNPMASPPNLTGIGARVRPKWMFEYLKNPAKVKIRPLPKVRMPSFDFSDGELQTIIAYFAAASGKDPLAFETTPHGPYDPSMVAAGKTLASTQYFNCFTCHALDNRRATGAEMTQGPNLALVPERIRPSSIVPWVQNPQAITPNVIMPAFLPEPGTGPPNVLEGDIDKQAEAIREYIYSITSD